MKRNRQEVIKLSDDEDHRAGKSVRREDESASLQEVIELRQRVAKLDKDLQGTRRIARGFELRMEEQQKRVDFLEDLLDKKPGVTDNAEYNNLLAELKRTREKVNSLTEELVAKTLRANEDQARNAELTRKLAEAQKREKRKAKEHQDKQAEISRRFEEARREAESELSGVIASLNEEIVRERSQIVLSDKEFNNRYDELMKQFEEVKWRAVKKEMELRDSACMVGLLKCVLDTERSQASQKEKQSGTKFAEISRQLQDGKRDAAKREGELLKKNTELYRELAQYSAGRQLKLQFPTSVEEKALARDEEMRKMSVAARAQPGWIRDAVRVLEDLMQQPCARSFRDSSDNVAGMAPVWATCDDLRTLCEKVRGGKMNTPRDIEMAIQALVRTVKCFHGNRDSEIYKDSVALLVQLNYRFKAVLTNFENARDVLSSLGISLERSMRIIPGDASQHARCAGRSDQNNFSSTANYEAADEDEAMEE